MADQSTSWKYSAVDTTQDQRSSRVAVRKPDSAELMGVDGSLDGPLRPFPGFLKVFDISLDNGSGNHDGSSSIIEFFPINFRVGEDNYAFGFVYRQRRKNNATGSSACDVYLVANRSDGVLLTATLFQGVPLTRFLDPILGKSMSVSVWGRCVYVFVQGRAPVSFQCSLSDPNSGTVRQTGPGLQPKLVSPTDAAALGSITSIDKANRPGSGQVILLDFLPSETAILPFSGTGSSDGSGTGYGQNETEINRIDPGDYAFAYLLHDSNTGRRSSLSDIAQCRKPDFDPDATTGSQEPIPLYAAIEITYDSSKFDQAYIYRSVRVQDAGGTYVASILQLDRIIDLTSYRTKNTLSGSLKQSVYWYELEDKQLVFQDVYTDRTQFDEQMPPGGISCWYENTMLVSGVRSMPESTPDERRASDAIRGVGEIRWSSLTETCPELFAPSNRYLPDIPSNEPEMFAKVGANVLGLANSKMYHIRKEGAYLKCQPMHEGYGVIGQHAADTVGDLLYFVSSKGLKSVGAMGELDDIRSLNYSLLRNWGPTLSSVQVAFDPALNALFLLNPSLSTSLVLWFNTAKVTSLRDTRFTACARGVWSTDNSYPYSGASLHERAFFLMNPAKNTPGDTTSTTARIFVVDHKREKTQTQGLHTGTSQLTMLPFPGDAAFTVLTPLSGSSFSVTVTGGKKITRDIIGYELYVVESSNASLLHKHGTIHNVGVLTDPDEVTIELTTGGAMELAGLSTDDVVFISPIYARWATSPVSIETDASPQFPGEASAPNYFTIKQISSIGLAFCDVEGTLPLDYPQLCSFTGWVFRGSESEPCATAKTLDFNNVQVRSIQDHEGDRYAAFGGTTEMQGRYGVTGSCITPAVVIVTSNLDFKILGMRVNGMVLDTVTTRRSTT